MKKIFFKKTKEKTNFDPGLAQAEIAPCLSVIDDFHISVGHLRRRRSGLQLHRLRRYSDPGSPLGHLSLLMRG